YSGVTWRTESFAPDGSLQYDDTFSHITVLTNEQCTGRLTVTKPSEVHDLYDSTVRVIHGTWYFNNLRDVAIQTGFRFGFANNFNLDNTKLNINQDWYENRKIIDNFIICRLEYANTSNNNFLIY